MIEAELKVRVHDAEKLHARLSSRASAEVCVYRDTYFDRPDGSLDRDGYELRVRTIESAGVTKTVLTYKEPSTDASGSKPEYEVEVSDAATAEHIVKALGYPPALTFRKHCTNYRFQHDGRHTLATVVEVSEIDGIFLEVESVVEPADLKPALDSLSSLLSSLGETDRTDEKYSDAVAAARR